MGFYIFDKNGNYIEKPHTFTAKENEYFSLEELMNKIYNEYPRYNGEPLVWVMNSHYKNLLDKYGCYKEGTIILDELSTEVKLIKLSELK